MKQKLGKEEGNYAPGTTDHPCSPLPNIKVTTVEKLTQEQIAEYEKLPQESL